MNYRLYRELNKKENKTEIEWELLRHYRTMRIVSEILVSESKAHISSEQAVNDIRKCMNDNL